VSFSLLSEATDHFYHFLMLFVGIYSISMAD